MDDLSFWEMFGMFLIGFMAGAVFVLLARSETRDADEHTAIECQSVLLEEDKSIYICK
jgi:hypothetical protein